MRVKDRTQNGRVKERGWLSFHFLRDQNRKSCSLVFLCSETTRKRLLHRLSPCGPCGPSIPVVVIAVVVLVVVVVVAIVALVLTGSLFIS